jgi:hypothetical protein
VICVSCLRENQPRGPGESYSDVTEGIRLRSSSKNEAVQMESAASSPTMSTVKSVTTLAITFAFFANLLRLQLLCAIWLMGR